MNFKIAKKNLIDKLTISLKAISSMTPLPILCGVKLVLENNELTLLSSDSNISIKTKITTEDDILEVIEEGKIVVDAKFLLEMVKRIDSSYVQIETIDGNYIRVFGSGVEYKINSFDVSEYPNILFNIPEKKFSISSSILIDAVDETSFACSDKEVRPVLTGVNFKASDNKLHVTASDSYRLAYKVIDLNESLDFNITIPCKYLSEVIKSLDPNGDVEIAVDAQQVFFIFSNTIIKTRLLDDLFPNTEKYIPTSFLYILKVDTKELLSQIDKTSIIKGEGKNLIRLSITKNLINIYSADENGSFSGKMNVVSFNGDNFEISCSYKDLQDALRAIGSNVVTISFPGEINPFIIKGDSNPNLTQLISPFRTYK